MPPADSSVNIDNAALFMQAAAVLLCVAIAQIGLWLFSPQKKSHSSISDGDIFAQQNIPSTVAERYELLKNDASGEVLEKVVKAARIKVAPRSELFTTLWLRTAGVHDLQGLKIWRNRILRNLVGALLLSILILSTKGVSAAAFFAPVLCMLAVAGVLYELRREALKCERAVILALRAIGLELRTALAGDNDVMTCLNTITRTVHLAINPDPVRLALAQAVDRMRAGQALDVALRAAARSIEVRHFSALCSYLIALHAGSREWKRQLDQLFASLDDYDKLIGAEKQPARFGGD